jgi:putative FmdB family regulatory protein
MPTYDYVCTKCKHEFEAFQKMTDTRLATCPKCNGKLKRLIGAGSGIIFKGSGFYATDYKKSSKPQSESSARKIAACPKQKEGCNGCG